jgi:hypothetical protein
MWMSVVYLFAALAIPAQARIVYTPVNIQLPTNGYYPIDLNHDGITDFTFQTVSGPRACNVNNIRLHYRLTVAPYLAGGGIVAVISDALALPLGGQIDSSASFYGHTALMYEK